MPILGILASSRPSAVDTGAMFPLQVITVGPAGASTVEFTNIPSNYTHLQIRGIANNGESSGWNNQSMQINSVTTNSYSVHRLYGDGTTAAAGSQTSATQINDIFRIPPTSTGYFGSFVIDIFDYTSTSKNKTVRSLNGGDGNGNGWIGLHSGLFYATPAAITSLKFISSVGNFGQYSQFALYGVKGAA